MRLLCRSSFVSGWFSITLIICIISKQSTCSIHLWLLACAPTRVLLLLLLLLLLLFMPTGTSFPGDRKLAKCRSVWNGYDRDSETVNELVRHTALKRWIAAEIRWYRNMPSRGSAVRSVALLSVYYHHCKLQWIYTVITMIRSSLDSSSECCGWRRWCWAHRCWAMVRWRSARCTWRTVECTAVRPRTVVAHNALSSIFTLQVRLTTLTRCSLPLHPGLSRPLELRESRLQMYFRRTLTL